jgi:hypothetical protein
MVKEVLTRPVGRRSQGSGASGDGSDPGNEPGGGSEGTGGGPPPSSDPDGAIEMVLPVVTDKGVALAKTPVPYGIGTDGERPQWPAEPFRQVATFQVRKCSVWRIDEDEQC